MSDFCLSKTIMGIEENMYSELQNVLNILLGKYGDEKMYEV